MAPKRSGSSAASVAAHIGACGSGAECCPNPGGKVHRGPNPGEEYPYYGMPCGSTGDCGACSNDGACLCAPYDRAGQTCCLPKGDVPPAPPPQPPSNVPAAFATIGLGREGYVGRERGGGGGQMLRATAPEATIVLDNTTYNVGGLLGQSEFAFLNASLLTRLQADPGAFWFTGHRIGPPQKRFEWTPGARHSDSTLAWPPKGVTLQLDFAAPGSALHAHRNVTVTVVYSMYDGLPLYEKHVVVKNGGTTNILVASVTADLLYPTPEAVGYWSSHVSGSLVAGTISGRIHMESEFVRGGGTTILDGDPRCNTCTQGASGDLVLSSRYPRGPGAQLGPTGFHGRNFSSFHTYVLLHDSDDAERQGLAIRKMYRMLAPQITENPIFMQATNTSLEGLKATVDQCVEAGFEMIMMSFGAVDMESKDPTYIESVAEGVAYAHSNGIEIGGYNLMTASRYVAPGGNCVGPDGAPEGSACLASDWADDYFATIKSFIEKTGFDQITTDGPFEGAECYAHNHSHHLGVNDSQWTQYERNMEFYAWCRARGMYIHSPDPYYMRGINKDGMGCVGLQPWNEQRKRAPMPAPASLTAVYNPHARARARTIVHCMVEDECAAHPS